MSNKTAYFDNAATTKISEQVLEGIMPYLGEYYGNPSSWYYTLGQKSMEAIKKAREQVATALNCEPYNPHKEGKPFEPYKPSEVFFTAGGSESNNFAIVSAMKLAAKQNRKHIITSAFEHHAVLHVCENLAPDVTVTYLPVYENGIVKIEDLEKAIRPDTALVTIMAANNEIGTIQPIAEIGAFIADWNKKSAEAGQSGRCLFHTDAVQAIGNIPIDVKAMNIDMLSLSGHKIHGMKGVGGLFVRKGLKLPPLIHGGAQEGGFRAGTENVAGIVGLGIAIEEATRDIHGKNASLLKKRERIYNEIMKIEKAHLNGDLESRLANNLNFSFEGVEGEALVLLHSLKGIAVSSGSACTSGSLDPSHVLLALGLPHEIAHGSLRISMSKYTTDEDVDYLLEELPPIVDKLREISSL